MTRTNKPPLTDRDTGLGGLLVHLPEYGVVICKDCRFAIQPSAFSSHLQNHHILRSERRGILEELASLHLPPPERVGVPFSDSKRIADLPVLSGHKCDTTECNYACTSLKRMCQHWSEVHDEPNSKAIKVRAARLQTFFRGNKIRYFEVEGPPDSQCWSQKQSQAAVSTLPQSIQSPSTSTTTDSEFPGFAFDDMQAPTIDYQTLHYMHHYIRNSGFSLNRGNETTNFWVDTVVFDAYNNPFLMNGILGMAAMDMARRATSSRERRKHMHASASYRTGTLSGYRAAVAAPNASNSNAIVACSRLLGVQEAVSDLITLQETDHQFRVEDILEHLVLLRGCSDLLIQLQHVLPVDSPLRLPPEIEAGLRQFESTENVADTFHPGSLPADIWLILYTLEAKLRTAELLPEDEVPMIRRAINALTRAASHCYAAKADDVQWATWNAVEGWLRAPVVLEGLMPAMRELRPAAMVVFASWALLLVKRNEAAYPYMVGLTAWFVRVTIDVSPGTQVEDLLREIYSLDE